MGRSSLQLHIGCLQRSVAALPVTEKKKGAVVAGGIGRAGAGLFDGREFSFADRGAVRIVGRLAQPPPTRWGIVKE